jgi:hypothetical protein
VRLALQLIVQSLEEDIESYSIGRPVSEHYRSLAANRPFPAGGVPAI